MLKLYWLRLKYWYLEMRGEKIQLFTYGGPWYFIDSRAVRHLTWDKEGVKFVYTWYGTSKIVYIRLSDIATIMAE